MKMRLERHSTPGPILDPDCQPQAWGWPAAWTPGKGIVTGVFLQTSPRVPCACAWPLLTTSASNASCGVQAASRLSFSRARKAQPHSATPGQSQSSQNSSMPTKSA
ncbi:hypothetical protein LEMLEM_LOCUS23525 [Lemmus lemmus]